MEITQMITLGLQIIGGATVLLNIIAPLTKTQKDDSILAFLKKILSAISLNVGEEESILKIKIKRK